jgi:pimeloyl-ACP methyl ester carboxylesterase
MVRFWQFGEQRSRPVGVDAVKSSMFASRSRLRSVGVMAVVFATLLVMAPIPATSASSAPNAGTPSVALLVNPADVSCGAGTVKINGQITPELTGYTSAIGLSDVPDGWTVRSSWEVTTPGGGIVGPQTFSLGGVDTPVVNPGAVSTIISSYVDDVRFAALVSGPPPTVFTYTVTAQLFDGQSQWMSGTAVTVECGGVVAVNAVDLNADVPVTAPDGVQTPPEPEAINWGPCDDPAALTNEQCATIQVPLDQFADQVSPAGIDSVDGIVIELALNRFPASGVSKGPMMTNPGGPGGSGLGFARGMASIYQGTSLTEGYDIIGMDPRGVADSSPAPFCMPATSQAGLDNVLAPDWTAYYDAAVPATGAANTGCSVAGARYLRFLGTRQVAADIDWIRRAEDVTRGGDPLDMNVWGGSYGTRLGEVYLQNFGDKAGNVVLSGAVDPASTYVSFTTDRVGPPDVVAQEMFFPAAPSQTEDQFFEVVQALTPANGQTPLDVAVPAIVDDQVTDITLRAFLGTVGGALRSEAAWPGTVAYIADTWTNVVGGLDVAIESPPLPEFGEPGFAVSGGGLAGVGGQLQLRVANAASADETRLELNGVTIREVVNCIDLPGVPTTSAEMASIATAAVPGDPVNYLGWEFATLDGCMGLAVTDGDSSPAKVWPALPFPAGTPAPLVIGSVGDTATPFSWSEDLDLFFQDAGIESVLLTYEGAEHVAGFNWPPSWCMYGPIVALFAGDGLPEPGTVCPFISTLNRQPPTDVNAQAGSGEVTLTWALSQQRLGGTVDGFVVEQRRQSDGEWVRVDQSGGSCDTILDEPGSLTCVVSGLSNGVGYQFRVATLPVYEPTALFSEASNEVTPSTEPPSSDPVLPAFTG